VKFDIEAPVAARQTGESLRASFAERLVWVAGSTHEGEEDQVLAAHRMVIGQRPDALLILVPRHPNRFEAVRAWLKSKQVTFVSRSRGEQVATTTSVLLADTLGELMMFYAAADIAFVGGSLIATVGGHNLLEPAVLERPVLVGPHNFNAPDIAQLMFESGAARQVNSPEELGRAILDLAADPTLRTRMGTQGSEMVAANRGALDRVVSLVEARLQASSNTA
jgi:3-deoxy-D-manno-octulosonic-acid transferase